MASYSIDTAAAIRKLKNAQCDEPLAEAIVEIVAARHDEIATKTDLELVEERLGTQIKELRVELKTDVADLRTEVAKQHSQIILWIVGTGIALFGGERILNLFLSGG